MEFRFHVLFSRKTIRAILTRNLRRWWSEVIGKALGERVGFLYTRSFLGIRNDAGTPASAVVER